MTGDIMKDISEETSLEVTELGEVLMNMNTNYAKIKDFYTSMNIFVKKISRYDVPLVDEAINKLSDNPCSFTESLRLLDANMRELTSLMHELTCATKKII